MGRAPRPTSSSSASPATRSFSTVSTCRGLRPWRRLATTVSAITVPLASGLTVGRFAPPWLRRRDGVLHQAVQPGAHRPAGVVAGHDHDLAQVVLVELAGPVGGRDLDGEHVLRAVGAEHPDQQQPPVAVGEAGTLPDVAEEVVGGVTEEVAVHVVHLEAVDLFHLLQAAATGFGEALELLTHLGSP